MNCNLPIVIQIACIIAGVFGVFASIVFMAKFAHGFLPIIRSLFTLLLCIALIVVEFYLFPFVKYFGFILKAGGKSLAYLFIGGCLFGKGGFPLACAIIYWILAIALCIMEFLFPQMALPILQGGYREGDRPDLSISSSKLYRNQGEQYQSVLNQDIANEIQ